jgi:hypothetical protein
MNETYSLIKDFNISIGGTWGILLSLLADMIENDGNYGQMFNQHEFPILYFIAASDSIYLLDKISNFGRNVSVKQKHPSLTCQCDAYI